VLEAETPGCATHITRTTSRRTSSRAEVKRFEGGHHRQHDGKTYDIARSLHRPRTYACESCDVIWSPSEYGVNNLLTTYGPQLVCPAGWPVDHSVVTPCSGVDHITPQDAQACNLFLTRSTFWLRLDQSHAVVLADHLYKCECGENAGGEGGNRGCTQIVWVRVCLIPRPVVIRLGGGRNPKSVPHFTQVKNKKSH